MEKAYPPLLQFCRERAIINPSLQNTERAVFAASHSVGAYTVHYRCIVERLPYFTKTEEERTFTSPFRPISPDKEDIRIYHISDAHNRVDAPVAAASYFGEELDLLVLNGDIPNHSGDVSYFEAIHQIAGRVTEGRIPAVFSRGNHDTRGIYAEKLEEYTPTWNGRSYYTFRLGSLWGLVLDCAEDKVDDHEAYGHTVCCHHFRMEQTKWLKQVIANAAKEYAAEGVKYRIVISHIPFSFVAKGEFHIERELYNEWGNLLREHIRPHILLTGHEHVCRVSLRGSEWDETGTQPCPPVVGSRFDPRVETDFTGAAVTLHPHCADVAFTNHNREVAEQQTVSYC